MSGIAAAAAGGNLTASAIMGDFSGALSYAGAQFTSVGLLMDPLKLALGSMTDVLGVSVNTALAPLVGIVTVLGQTVGKLLLPAVQGLTPILEAVGKGFSWFYDKVIMPVGNGVWAFGTALIHMLMNLGTVIWQIVTLDWANLGKGLKNTNIGELYKSGPLTAIGDLGAQNAGAAAIANAGGTAASYTQARDITVNVVINTDVITGEGGFRELAIKLQNEIQAVLALGLA